MSPLLAIVLAALAAAALAWLAIALTRPLMVKLALARPNARSSHREPIPQGAGLGLMAALVATALGATGLASGIDRSLVFLVLAALGLTALGLIDDIRPLRWRLKLVLQILFCLLAVAGLPPALRLLPLDGLYWPERAVMTVALVAMVNIVNFIDGIDEITAAHCAPALAAAALAGALSLAGPTTGLTAGAGLGAVAGFWLWNRHPARIFLGDAGSLPLGLVVGWLALRLSAEGALVAGLLIVLYPVTDATLTLAGRLMRGCNIAEPHRDHGYQRAVDSGVAVRRVSAVVALISAATAVLALVALAAPYPAVQVLALAIGLCWTVLPVVGWQRLRAAAAASRP